MGTKKKVTMKARGIRFHDQAWKNLNEEADRKRCSVSDIVRRLVDCHYSNPTKEGKT